MDLRDQLQATLGAAYIVERELGGGGMSRVFVANETRLDRRVVVKVLPPELAEGVNAERFEREIRVAASLQQANIVPVLSAGETGGLPFYIMPYVDGESVRARLGTFGAFPVGDAVSILRDVARALAYAHARGVVHRDIKPDNILLSGGTAVVTDFGIAKAIAASRTRASGATLTQFGMSVGTPAYLSPEQAAGDPDVDHRADIYSLGCTAYELLTGQPPFANRTPQRTMAAQLTETPQPLIELRPGIPPSLADLVMRCLAKDPGARPQSADELVMALDAATTSNSSLSAAPSILLPGRGTLAKALAAYAGAFIIVAVLAKLAITGIGLPDWVFPGALLVMALALPVILFTGYAQYVARRAVSATPTLTPGGTMRPRSSGAVETFVMKASPHVSFRRATAIGYYGVGAFVFVVGGYMLMRALGIGPAASLMAAGKLGHRERVILAELMGPETDPTLGATVTEALRTDLGQSSNLSIVPQTTVRDVLLRMQRPGNTRVDYAVAREVAAREGVKALLDGQIVLLGGGYVLSARLVSASSGEELASFRETANGPTELIPAISRLSKSIRSKVGESLRSVQNAPPLERVTTPSLEALRKYIAGTNLLDNEADFERGMALLDEAITLDSGFAMAYRKQAIELSNRGLQTPRQQALLVKAYAHRDRLSDLERALTTAGYYEFGPEPNRTKVMSAYESALEIDPDNITALNNLSTEYLNRRDFAHAEQLLKRALEVQPTVSVVYQNLADAEMDQRKFADAEKTIQLFGKNLPRSPASARLRAQLALNRDSFDVAVAIADSLHLARPNEQQQTGNVALLAFTRGQLKTGLRLRTEVRTRNLRAGNKQAALNLALDEPEVDVWYRNQKARALAGIQRALAADPIDSIPLVVRPYERLVVLYSLAERPDLAKQMARTAEKQRASTDPSDAEASRHNMAGHIALAEHRYEDAVREFRGTDVGACVSCALPDIANAYDLAGNADSAIAVFARYVGAPNRSLAVDYWSLAGAHKRLGELYEAKGNRAAATTEYAAFLELWKNADADLQPIVADVRKRLARLSNLETARE